MKKNNFIIYLKFPILFLIIYNMFSLSLIFIPNVDFKKRFWQNGPYDYIGVLGYSNNLSTYELLNKNNQKLIIHFLNKNKNKNYLDVDYWNYKQTIEAIDKKNKSDFEKSFYNAFILSKNNVNKKLILKNYFISNYKTFSGKYRNLIISNFI
jgi:hypothetical protein